MTRPLYEIANDIALDWENPHYTAVPYLNAMASLDTLDDKHGQDDAESVVLYFLSNSGKWRGPIAREIKKELRGMLKRRGLRASPQRVVQAYTQNYRIPSRELTRLYKKLERKFGFEMLFPTPQGEIVIQDKYILPDLQRAVEAHGYKVVGVKPTQADTNPSYPSGELDDVWAVIVGVPR